MGQFHRKYRQRGEHPPPVSKQGDGRRTAPTALPRLWLLTDERIADDTLIASAARLPRGSGIVFRHYGLDRQRRTALFERVRKVARKRGLILLLADKGTGRALGGADGVHWPEWRAGSGRSPCRALLSVAAHGPRGLIAAKRAGADLAFLSPAFPTRSHPGGKTLGAVRFGLIASRVRVPIIALGGVDSARFRRLRPLGAYGWGAIDALTQGRSRAQT